jgi:hypothetical protein
VVGREAVDEEQDGEVQEGEGEEEAVPGGFKEYMYKIAFYECLVAGFFNIIGNELLKLRIRCIPRNIARLLWRSWNLRLSWDS